MQPIVSKPFFSFYPVGQRQKPRQTLSRKLENRSLTPNLLSPLQGAYIANGDFANRPLAKVNLKVRTGHMHMDYMATVRPLPVNWGGQNKVLLQTLSVLYSLWGNVAAASDPVDSQVAQRRYVNKQKT
ncbi:hypothetical protein L596_029408 [Steinernema carpocapsae]|uniref:Uncharacterized protein n=1 Tax=Steinernema carpocapsae TaxID=34508 RepID=A0A4U5LUJ3_STECR|nr:hypothetical protein L596_029408 [Steinernema carpocapsae]